MGISLLSPDFLAYREAPSFRASFARPQCTNPPARKMPLLPRSILAFRGLGLRQKNSKRKGGESRTGMCDLVAIENERVER